MRTTSPTTRELPWVESMRTHGVGMRNDAVDACTHCLGNRLWNGRRFQTHVHKRDIISRGLLCLLLCFLLPKVRLESRPL